MFTLYEFPLSGNCYKIRLTLSLLNIEYERIKIDITKGESRTEEFLKINPNGKVPVLKTESGEILRESNAAAWFLAQDSKLIPTDKLEQTKMLQWMFFEQNQHLPFLSRPRFLTKILKQGEEFKEQIEQLHEGGYKALEIMEMHLKEHDYFVSDRVSLADVVLYAYTHVAHEGGYNLSGYPAINAWLMRIERLENYVGINS